MLLGTDFVTTQKVSPIVILSTDSVITYSQHCLSRCVLRARGFLSVRFLSACVGVFSEHGVFCLLEFCLAVFWFFSRDGFFLFLVCLSRFCSHGMGFSVCYVSVAVCSGVGGGVCLPGFVRMGWCLLHVCLGLVSRGWGVISVCYTSVSLSGFVRMG